MSAIKILALSGWGQSHDALADVLPHARHFDYAGYETVRDALAAIADAGTGYDAIVGWSLGGQLAVRAIAAGMLKPKKLVLIAAPFQFVETPRLKLGMKRDAYEKFRHNYQKNPERTLHKAWELIIKDDTRHEHVRHRLAAYDKAEVLTKDWLNWLHLLDGFSCADLHLADFPPTLLLQGENDVVVGANQMGHFTHAIPHAQGVLLNDCGHAPHWHDTPKVKQMIAEHVSV